MSTWEVSMNCTLLSLRQLGWRWALPLTQKKAARVEWGHKMKVRTQNSMWVYLQKIRVNKLIHAQEAESSVPTPESFSLRWHCYGEGAGRRKQTLLSHPTSCFVLNWMLEPGIILLLLDFVNSGSSYLHHLSFALDSWFLRWVDPFVCRLFCRSSDLCVRAWQKEELNYSKLRKVFFSCVGMQVRQLPWMLFLDHNVKDCSRFFKWKSSDYQVKEVIDPVTGNASFLANAVIWSFTLFTKPFAALYILWIYSIAMEILNSQRFSLIWACFLLEFLPIFETHWLFKEF